MPDPEQPQGLHEGFKVRPRETEARPARFLALQESANALVIVVRLIEALHEVAVTVDEEFPAQFGTEVKLGLGVVAGGIRFETKRSPCLKLQNVSGVGGYSKRTFMGHFALFRQSDPKAAGRLLLRCALQERRE